MSPVRLIVLSTGAGVCSLTGKETDGLTVTFEDGTVQESFLSWKAFRQLLGLKAGQPKAAPKSAATVPAGNGNPAVMK